MCPENNCMHHWQGYIRWMKGDRLSKGDGGLDITGQKKVGKNWTWKSEF